MDDLNVTNHLAIASEAFMQIIELLARILTISAGIAFAVTVVVIIQLCLTEGRQALPETGVAAEPVRASRKAILAPVKLSIESRQEAMGLSPRRRQA